MCTSEAEHARADTACAQGVQVVLSQTTVTTPKHAGVKLEAAGTPPITTASAAAAAAAAAGTLLTTPVLRAAPASVVNITTASAPDAAPLQLPAGDAPAASSPPSNVSDLPTAFAAAAAAAPVPAEPEGLDGAIAQAVQPLSTTDTLPFAEEMAAIAAQLSVSSLKQLTHVLILAQEGVWWHA